MPPAQEGEARVQVLQEAPGAPGRRQGQGQRARRPRLARRTPPRPEAGPCHLGGPRSGKPPRPAGAREHEDLRLQRALADPRRGVRALQVAAHARELRSARGRDLPVCEQRRALHGEQWYAALCALLLPLPLLHHGPGQSAAAEAHRQPGEPLHPLLRLPVRALRSAPRAGVVLARRVHPRRRGVQALARLGVPDHHRRLRGGPPEPGQVLQHGLATPANGDEAPRGGAPRSPWPEQEAHEGQQGHHRHVPRPGHQGGGEHRRGLAHRLGHRAGGGRPHAPEGPHPARRRQRGVRAPGEGHRLRPRPPLPLPRPPRRRRPSRPSGNRASRARRRPPSGGPRRAPRRQGRRASPLRCRRLAPRAVAPAPPPRPRPHDLASLLLSGVGRL
mmetsp:Transcript_59580/g.184881  ORF Transcript_59580/g.184881 Transcript_59580/m.184881 type:complete len:388 (+) Transcript_59580:97-1260(+)